MMKIFLVIATAWLFDAMDIGAMSFVLGSIRMDFHLTARQTGILGSASFLGMFIGAALAGYLADRLGRRPILQWSMLLWGASSILCGIAPSFRTLLAARVLLGAGLAMELPVAQSLVSELMPAGSRGRAVAILEGIWPVGFILAGVLASIALPLFGWRGIFIALGISSAFVFVVRRVVPESPRWQRTQLQLPELFRNIYGQRTIMLWILWFFALLGFYGLTTWLAALQQQAGISVASSVRYTVLISLGGIPGFLCCAWLIERWGRKPVCTAALLGGALMAYLYSHASPHWFILPGLGMQFFVFGLWSVLYAYTPELYPTRLRATGTGFASSVGRLGALLGPYLIGLMPHNAFAIGANSFLVAAFAVIIFGIETKGQPLERLSP